VLDDTPGAELTLTTCNPRYSASQRLIVVAVLKSSRPTGVAGPTRPHHGATSKKAALTTGGSASELVGGTTSGVMGAVLWGVTTLVVAGLVAVLWRRWRRPGPRWATAVVGVPGVLAALFVFFGHVSSLLPASF
jgi:hypothetical protein